MKTNHSLVSLFFQQIILNNHNDHYFDRFDDKIKIQQTQYYGEQKGEWPGLCTHRYFFIVAVLRIGVSITIVCSFVLFFLTCLGIFVSFIFQYTHKYCIKVQDKKSWKKGDYYWRHRRRPCDLCIWNIQKLTGKRLKSINTKNQQNERPM